MQLSFNFDAPVQPVQTLSNIDRAIEFCEEFLREKNLWRFGWRVHADHAKCRAGVCHHRNKTIGLSAPIAELNQWAATENTIRHEVAHAAVGAGYGHGATWKRKAIEFGAKPQACGDLVVPKGKFTLMCTLCGEAVKEYHRKPGIKNFSNHYARCCGVVSKGKLVLIENGKRSQ